MLMAVEPSAGRSGLDRADRWFGAAVDALAALLVVGEIVILLSGVIARYLFHTPLVWSDELASILFLWLSMLGVVCAVRRSEHMRMTGLVTRVGPRMRAFLEALSVAAPLAFLVLILPHAWHYAEEEGFIVTAALEISNSWRASALPAGLLLMIVAAALRLARLLRDTDRTMVLAAVAVTLVVMTMFWFAGPTLKPLGQVNLVIFFVVLVAGLVFSGVLIAFAFALATFGYLGLTTSTPLMVMVGRLDEGMGHLILLAVPLFIFLGALIEMTGISGSKIADMAAIAPVLFPEMEKRGARRGDLLALLAATGAQTETVPPSIVLITIGSVTGISIAALSPAGCCRRWCSVPACAPWSGAAIAMRI